MKLPGIVLIAILFLVSCGAPAAPAPASTLTPQPTATGTPLPTATLPPTPTPVGGGSGRLTFVNTKEQFAAAFPDLKGESNVFTANADGSNIVPVTNGLDEWNFLTSVSPSGRSALVSTKPKWDSDVSSLYLIDLTSPQSTPRLLAEDLPSSYGTNYAARWIDEGRLAYIGKGDAGPGIYLIDADGANAVNIYKYLNTDTNKPLEIIGIGKTRVYWDALVKVPLGGNRYNYRYYVSWSSLDGSDHGTLQFKGKSLSTQNFDGPEIGFSPDGEQVAWIEELPTHMRKLHIAPVDDPGSAATMDVMSSPVLEWLPDSSGVLIFDAAAASYGAAAYFRSKGKPCDTCGLYEVSASPGMAVKSIQVPDDTLGWQRQESGGRITNCSMNLYDISPDGSQLLVAGCSKNDGSEIKMNMMVLNLKTTNTVDLSVLPAPDWRRVGSVHWLP